MSRARLWLVALALAGSAACKDPEPPGGFGVNLTIKLGAGVFAQASAFTLTVTGAEEFNQALGPGVFDDSEARLRYVPGVMAGTLTFHGEVFDAGGALIATGTTPDVVLATGSAVDATLALNGAGGPGCVPACEGDTYCDTDGTCKSLKTAGATCTGTGECASDLGCIDGVCCSVTTCGPCQNCGADGQCSALAPVGPDETGQTCNGTMACDVAGACKLGLGQDCGSGSASLDEANAKCATGFCVDGVCCGSATCPACRNCGATGACDVTVGSAVGADDLSGDTCMGADHCDAGGACKPQWSLVASDPGLTIGNTDSYVTGLGDFVYYANSKNAPVQYLRSVNVNTGALLSHALTNNNLDNVGYNGTLVASTGKLFMIEGEARYHVILGGTDWAQMGVATYTAEIRRGEAGFAVSGNRIYQVGGRNTTLKQSTTVHTWDATTLAFTASGVVDTPLPTTRACVGVLGGKVYIMGYLTFDGADNPTFEPKSWVYDEANPAAGWVARADIPHTCSESTGYAWDGKLAFAASGSVRIFDPVTNTWPAAIPFPAGTRWEIATAGTPPGLYAVGQVGSAVNIYKLNFELD